MRRLSSLAVVLVAAGLLAACQPSLSGKASQDVTPNAVIGDAIETTALDAPSTEPAGTEPAPGAAAAGADVAAAQSDPQATAETAPDATPVADKSDDSTGTEVNGAEPAPTPDLTDVPVTPKSERQLACEKKKGRWAKVGKGEARACVFQTKDSGKRCERESQCDRVCLARSGTCAPYKPMYGCNEILQDNGARVTLCLD
jgi:hypothetical protein